MSDSPTLEGLRLVFWRPSLALRELAWRWSFAITAWLLVLFLAVEYLDSLSVTRGDLLLLRSGLPWLAMGAIRHILLSGAERLAAATSIVLLAIGALWMVAGSAGRAATLHAIVRVRARREVSRGSSELPATGKSSARSASSPWLVAGVLLGVHFLRLGLLSTALVGWAGALILAGLPLSEPDPQPGLAFLLFFGLTSTVVLLWQPMDQLLSMAPLFSIRDGEGLFASICAATRFVLARSGSILRTGALFLVIHVVLFFAATSLASMLLTLSSILPRTMVAGLILLALVYLVLFDFLQVAKLAAYISIVNEGYANFRPAQAGQQLPRLSMPGRPRPADAAMSDIAGLRPPLEPV
ncbi:MAG: hypothetical protein JOZ36_10145 [Acidobacteria bacterium]|nr:hypothetical protein [Acidobacteriota bacterium]